jgi:hypothetical protein
MPNKTITVSFTVQSEEDFFATLEDVMLSDQTGFSSYTVLDSSDDGDSSGEDDQICGDGVTYKSHIISSLLPNVKNVPMSRFSSEDLYGLPTKPRLLDEMPLPTAKEIIEAVNEIVKSIESSANSKISPMNHSWRLIYGESLESEVFSNSFENLKDYLSELEESYTPYCVMEFVEGAGWECYHDFMGGEQIYFGSLYE